MVCYSDTWQHGNSVFRSPLGVNRQVFRPPFEYRFAIRMSDIQNSLYLVDRHGGLCDICRGKDPQTLLETKKPGKGQ